jgi:hypothetical protein
LVALIRVPVNVAFVVVQNQYRLFFAAKVI